MFDTLIAIQLLFNLSNLIDYNKNFLSKNVDIRIQIIKQVGKLQEIRENDFKPDEVNIYLV